MSDPRLNRSALVAGVFFIAAGAVFLLERIGVWDVSLRVLSPVLLITLGIAIIPVDERLGRPPEPGAPIRRAFPAGAVAPRSSRRGFKG